MKNGDFFTSESNRNRDKWKHADSDSNGQKIQSENSGLSEIELNQKQHEEVLHQMKLDTAWNGVIAVATLVTVIILYRQLQHHLSK